MSAPAATTYAGTTSTAATHAERRTPATVTRNKGGATRGARWSDAASSGALTTIATNTTPLTHRGTPTSDSATNAAPGIAAKQRRNAGRMKDAHAPATASNPTPMTR